MTPATRALARQAARVARMSGTIPSPCVSVCRMDAAGALCQGCWRTLAEIGGWSRMTDPERQQVWHEIALRVAAAEATP